MIPTTFGAEANVLPKDTVTWLTGAPCDPFTASLTATTSLSDMLAARLDISLSVVASSASR